MNLLKITTKTAIFKYFYEKEYTITQMANQFSFSGESDASWMKVCQNLKTLEDLFLCYILEENKLPSAYRFFDHAFPEVKFKDYKTLEYLMHYQIEVSTADEHQFTGKIIGFQMSKESGLCVTLENETRTYTCSAMSLSQDRAELEAQQQVIDTLSFKPIN
jgi:hypothetical protein